MNLKWSMKEFKAFYLMNRCLSVNSSMNYT